MRPLADYQGKENYVTYSPDPFWWNNHHFLGRLIFDLRDYFIDFVEPRVVADLGCNHGALTAIMAGYSRFVIGIDLMVKCIHYNAKMMLGRNEADNRQLSFVQGDIRTIPLHDQAIDTITCFHTLEHIWPGDMPYVIKEIKRILKPDGYLIVSVPEKDAYWTDQHVFRFDDNNFEQVIDLPCLAKWKQEQCINGIFSLTGPLL